MTAKPRDTRDPLGQALRLLSLGFSVIPIKSRDKKPALNSWKEFQTRRPTEAEVRGWFADTALNVAIVTGAVSRVVVIDGDSPEAVSWLATNHPSPIRTSTSKGRKHFFFLHPGHAVRNGAKLAGMALDVRGDGGYVVAPGSVHSSGAIYTEEGDWSEIDHLPTFQASWLAEKVQPLVRPQEALDKRVRAYIAATPGAVQGQGGDAHTFRMACKLVREFLLPDDLALAYLADWNSKCSPPWSMMDLQKKITSAVRSGTAPMGSKIESDHRRPNTWRPPTSTTPSASVDAGGDGSLEELLRKNDKGRWLKTPRNLALILRLHDQWGGKLSLNEMTREIFFEGNPVDDTFIDWAQEQIEGVWHLAFGREEVAAKLLAQASAQTIHPIREWLLGLTWDRTERIAQLATKCLGAESPMATHYLRCTMVGAVRRVIAPGTKMDTLPVLEGAQGLGKSSFWRTLVGPHWFGDSPLDLDSKDGMMTLHRKWCTELSEIDHATGNKAAERIKAFLSSSEDVFRPPFSKSVCVFPRSCFMVGTTNREGFLVDPTGSRRFWPIACARINLELLAEWREQLWAEAMDLHRAGIPHWLDHTQEALRQEEAEQFESQDPWDEQIDLAVEALSKIGRYKTEGYSVTDLLTQMGISVAQQTRAFEMRVAQLLKRKKWTRKRVGVFRTRRWFL